jgi:hypothetical protein
MGAAVLLTSIDDISLLYRESILITPFLAAGVGAIIGRSFHFLKSVIDEDLPALLPRLSQGVRKTIAVAIPVVVIAGALIPSFVSQVGQVLHGFETLMDSSCIQHPKAAMEAAHVINSKVAPGDLVLESHFGWLLRCRTVSLMQSAVRMGGRDYPVFPEEVFRNRFLFDCSYRKAKFVVLHPFAYDFASQFEKVDEIIANVERWPVEARFQDIVIYRNPGASCQPLTEEEIRVISTARKTERLERRIARGDREPDTFNNLGTAYSISGDFKKAKYCYEIAVELKPDYALAHFNLGNLYYKAFGDSENAARHFEAFLALAPEDPRCAKAREILGKINKPDVP